MSAALLRALRAAGSSVVYLEQDHFRNTVAGSAKGGAARALACDMLEACARVALRQGHPVLMEGILSKPHHGPMFERLATDLGLSVRFVYLDVPLEATKARHLGRAKAAEFGADKLEEWFGSASRMVEEAGSAGGKAALQELVVPAESTLEQTVAAVMQLFQ